MVENIPVLFKSLCTTKRKRYSDVKVTFPTILDLITVLNLKKFQSKKRKVELRRMSMLDIKEIDLHPHP